MQKHIVLCGLGRLGYRILRLLLEMGEEVAVIARNPREEWAREVEEKGVPLLRADARSLEALRAAEVPSAKAVIIATDNDLANLEIAIDAASLNPQAAVILRLFDPALARGVETGFGIRAVYSLPSLAAPIFAAAAMGEQLLASFAVEETSIAIARWPVDGAFPATGEDIPSLNRRFGVSVLAWRRDSSEWHFCPTCDFRPGAGDELLIASTLDVLESLNLYGAAQSQKRRQETGWKGALRKWGQLFSPLKGGRFLKQIWQGAPLPLKTIFMLLVLIVLAEVAVFQYALRLNIVDAIYFVTETVTTVGYGDISLQNQPALVKLFGCFMMLSGAALIATLYSIIADYVVSARFDLLLGRGLQDIRSHIVVAGLGSLGYRVVELLMAAGESVVAIERSADSEFVRSLSRRIPIIIGDARVPETLEQARVATARSVMALTDNELVNLGVALSTAECNPDARIVMRTEEPGLAAKIKNAFRFSAVLNAAELAAPTFAATALYRHTQHCSLMDIRPLLALKLPLPPPLHGLTPAEIRTSQHVVVVLRRSPETASFHYVQEDEPLSPGDEILVVAPRPAVEWLESMNG